MEIKNVVIKAVIGRNVGTTSRGKKYKSYDVVMEGKLSASGEDFSIVANKMIYESDDAPELTFEQIAERRGLVVGNKGNAYVQLRAREYQGKWYSSDLLYKFEATGNISATQTETQEENDLRAIAAENQQRAMNAIIAAKEAGEDTDLPFEKLTHND